MDVEGEGGREGVERIMYCHSVSWCFFLRVYCLSWFGLFVFHLLSYYAKKRNVCYG